MDSSHHTKPTFSVFPAVCVLTKDSYSTVSHVTIRFAFQKKNQAFYTLRMLGPFNGRVGTCMAGVRFLKIAVFEGSGFLHAGSISTWITKQRQQGTRNVFLQWLAFTSSFKASSSTTWQTNISNISNISEASWGFGPSKSVNSNWMHLSDLCCLCILSTRFEPTIFYDIFV